MLDLAAACCWPLTAVVGAGVLFTQDTIAQAIALATTTPAGKAPDNSSTTPCSYGSYFPGGPFVGDITCLPCPLGSTTKGLGATSPNDCMVPPGYFIQLDAAGAATGKMVKCPENADGQGYFRAGWVRFDDENVQEAGSGTTACSSCGKGIKSALTDVDEALGGTDTAALVAGSSFSCYIETGWGMMPTGVVKADYTMEFAATVCDKNTYGVANTTFGLQATPCKVRICGSGGCNLIAALLGTQQLLAVYLLHHCTAHVLLQTDRSTAALVKTTAPGRCCGMRFGSSVQQPCCQLLFLSSPAGSPIHSLCLSVHFK